MAGTAGTGLYRPLSVTSNSPELPPKLDTHVHLFNLKRFTYPWLARATEINRNFDVRDFEHASASAGIGKWLFMESGAAAGEGLQEALWVESLKHTQPTLAGLIAKLDLGETNALDTLKQLTQLSLFKGIRGPLPADDLISATFEEGMKWLSIQNFTFDLLIGPSQLSQAARLCAQFSENQFILDHLGNPDLQAPQMDTWKEGLRALAALPNVAVKISGLITRCGDQWNADMIRPWTDFTIQQFGSSRLVYGGDWPVVLRAGTYQQWSDLFAVLTNDLTYEEKQQVYYQNAERIYGLDH